MGFDFNEMMLTAYGTTVAMKPKHSYKNPLAALLELVQEYDDTEESAVEENDMSTIASYYNTPNEITESHYKKIDADAVVREQKQLTEETMNQAFKHFSGKLGFYPHKKKLI
jgi:hypothetical protein